MSEVTQEQYRDRLNYLEPEFDFPLAEPDDGRPLRRAGPMCSGEVAPAYAGKMVTALSSMFALAVPRGWMKSNPATGIKHAYTPDPNANREWLPEEWRTVIERAPPAL